MTNLKHDKDYDSFLESEGTQAPKDISNFILVTVKKDLDPDIKLIYAKLLAVQAFVGTLTLLFCPQFSISITGQDAMFHIFHKTFGMYGCMAICGSIFVGSGAIASSLMLKSPEVLKIHRHNFFTFSIVSFLSLLVFSLFGGAVQFGMASTWLAGAAIGGLIMFEFGRILKNRAH